MVAQVTAIRYKAQHKSPLSLPRGVESKFCNGKPSSSIGQIRPVKGEVAGSTPASAADKPKIMSYMQIDIKVRILKYNREDDSKGTKAIYQAKICAFPTDVDHQLRLPLLLEIEEAVKAKVAEINQRLSSGAEKA